MESLLATAGLMTVAVFTPGPNNLIVLRESAQRGWKGVLPVSIGVVLGGLAMLMAVAAGADALLRVDPRSTRLLGAGACSFLVAFGVALIRGGSRAHPESPAPGITPARRLGSLGGMFLFQFLNPKSWILVVAVVSSIRPASELAAALPPLVALFVLVPAAGMTLWSLAGLLLMGQLERPAIRRWFDRLTGGLLIGFAVLLLLGGLDLG